MKKSTGTKGIQQKRKRHKTRHNKLVEFEDLQNLSRKLRKAKKKIVFATGSFDLLNAGHCRYLAEAKARGDILVVGISSDASVARIKGSYYPLMKEDIRAELICHMKSVDYATIVDVDRPHAVLVLLQPHIFFTYENDWARGVRTIQDKIVAKTYGGKVIIRRNHQPYFGIHIFVEHIASIRVIQILESYLKEKIPDFYIDPVVHLKPADFGLQKPSGKDAFDSNKLIVSSRELKKLGEALKTQDKKTVFVSGSYDLLHVGHARFIEQAGLLGDILVVGIPSDRSLRRLKGLGRPVIAERSRAYVLGHLDSVDYVTIFDDTTVLSTLESLKPDIFFTVNEDWNKGYKKSPEYQLLRSYGGKIARAKRQAPHFSASIMINKIASKKVREIFRECMDEERYKDTLNETSKLNNK